MSWKLPLGAVGLGDLYGAVCSELRRLDFFERCVVLLWLTGPFVLLVERTPADIWLTCISLSFLYFLLTRKLVLRPVPKWVLFLLLFVFFGFLSAGLSQNQIYSVTEFAVWLRFPIFAMAVVFWLAKSKQIINAYLVVLFLAIMTHFIILTAELTIIGHQHWGRLSWPFGDLTAGNYLTKVGLPTLIFATFAFLKGKGNAQRALSFVYVLVFLTFCILAGERINFLISLCSTFLVCFLALRTNVRNAIVLISTSLVVVFSAFVIDPGIKMRFVDAFLTEVPFTIPEFSPNYSSAYFKTIYPAIAIFKEHVMLGIGPANYRDMCLDMIPESINMSYWCNNHPHNYFAQLAVETGVLGLIAGSMFIISIIIFSFPRSVKQVGTTYGSILFIVPLAFFWPVAMHSDFFGQWNNIFVWHSIAFALAFNFVEENMNK
jgi:O-antigen ligase